MIERKLQEVSDQHEHQKDAAGNMCHGYFLLTSCKGIHAKELQMHMTLKKPAGNLQEISIHWGMFLAQANNLKLKDIALLVICKGPKKAGCRICKRYDPKLHMDAKNICIICILFFAESCAKNKVQKHQSQFLANTKDQKEAARNDSALHVFLDVRLLQSVWTIGTCCLCKRNCWPLINSLQETQNHQILKLRCTFWKNEASSCSKAIASLLKSRHSAALMSSFIFKKEYITPNMSTKDLLIPLVGTRQPKVAGLLRMSSSAKALETSMVSRHPSKPWW